MLQAVGGLDHGVVPLAQGQLPAEEGCGAFRFHPLDRLTCWGNKRDALRRVPPREGARPQGSPFWSLFRLSSPLHSHQLREPQPDPQPSHSERIGVGGGQSPKSGHQGFHLMVGLLWCLNLFEKRLERGTNVQLKNNSQGCPR